MLSIMTANGKASIGSSACATGGDVGLASTVGDALGEGDGDGTARPGLGDGTAAARAGLGEGALEAAAAEGEEDGGGEVGGEVGDGATVGEP
jgi:hypothetical protein